MKYSKEDIAIIVHAYVQEWFNQEKEADNRVLIAESLNKIQKDHPELLKLVIHSINFLVENGVYTQ
jgi:3-methyladenine DNA glycosylase AlkC